MIVYLKTLEIYDKTKLALFFADTAEDLSASAAHPGISYDEIAPGSKCTTANGDKYLLNSSKQWIKIENGSSPSPTPIETSYIYNDNKYSTNELQTSDGAREITLNKLTGKSVVEDGEIKSVSMTKITVDGTEYPVSFNGKSANNAYDELDLVNKKYIQRIGSFDLSSMGKKSESSGYFGWQMPASGLFETLLDDDFNIKLPFSYSEEEIYNESNIIFKNYRVISYAEFYAAISEGGDIESINKCICASRGDWKAVFLVDMDYSDLDSFFASIQGDMMNYEKAVPDETTVEIDPITAEVASKSTITFDTDLDVGSEMTIKIEVVV